MSEFRTPAPPVVNEETEPYWQAVAERRLLIKRCNDCGEAHFYPRTLCPFCHSVNTEWEEASGRGVLYTFSVMRRAQTPFALAYVTLDEGPTMLTNIVDCDFDALAIGQRMRVAFRPASDDSLVPCFAPQG